MSFEIKHYSSCFELLKLVDCDKKNRSRIIYDNENDFIVPNRWARGMGTITGEWKKYDMVLKDLKDVKLKDFQFKKKNK